MSVISDIESHIKSEGSGYGAWYCGIAAKPRDRLFSDHNVPQQNSWWIIRDCGTEYAARQVEAYFHAKGCKGGGGGGDRNTKAVYAYRITSNTDEAA